MIHDLSPIKKLKALSHLYVPDNQIQDLTPVASLENLQKIWVDYNQITDLQPIHSLSKLAVISANNNQIAEASPLAAMPALWEIYLANNPLSGESIDILEHKKANGSTVLYGERIQVSINGNLQNYSPEESPRIIQDIAFVPLRKIFTALGTVVQWDEGTRSIVAANGQTEIKLSINSKIASVNGVKVELEEAPKIVNNITVVPLRFVTEALGEPYAGTKKSSGLKSTSKSREVQGYWGSNRCPLRDDGDRTTPIDTTTFPLSSTPTKFFVNGTS